MPVPPAVVVNAAGLGTRLARNHPKALLAIDDRPLIEWQLRMLRDVDDVRVVVGYHASAVADVVFGLRPDAMVVLNHNYATTGTAASLMLGAAAYPADSIVSLDCDLVVHPDDLREFVAGGPTLLGVLEPQSVEPVRVRIEGDQIVDFDRDARPGDHEWSGLIRFDPEDPRLGDSRGHVFEMARGLLPARARKIRAREVDYPEEVADVEEWVRMLRREGVL